MLTLAGYHSHANDASTETLQGGKPFEMSLLLVCSVDGLTNGISSMVRNLCALPTGYRAVIIYLKASIDSVFGLMDACGTRVSGESPIQWGEGTTEPALKN